MNNINSPIASLARNLFDGEFSVNMQYAKSLGWVTCPIEMISLMDKALSGRICNTFGNTGGVSYVSVIEYKIKSLDKIMKIPCDGDSLYSWSVHSLWSNWLIVSGDLDAAILCTGDNFNVVTGLIGKVEKLLGMPFEEAKSAFVKFYKQHAGTVDEAILKEQIDRYF